MLNMLYITSFSMTMSFMFLNHPLSMGLNLLIQTLIIAMITGLMNLNFWFSYILFIIMIGGMLVLFIYMTSIASNEKFNFNNQLMIIVIPIYSMSMFTIIIDSMMMNLVSKNNDLMLTELNHPFQLYLTKYINMPTNIIMITMIIYLLITLTAVVKITNIYHGPLRQNY